MTEGFTRVEELNPGKKEGENAHRRTLCISEHWIRHRVRGARGFPSGSAVKNPPAMQETCIHQYFGHLM